MTIRLMGGEIRVHLFLFLLIFFSFIFSCFFFFQIRGSQRRRGTRIQALFYSETPRHEDERQQIKSALSHCGTY